MKNVATAGNERDNWWRAFYEETPFELYMERTNDAVLAATVDFLMDKLHLAPGASVFDQCCGFGSISLPLARRGMNVLGVDLCTKYIEKARHRAHSQGLECRFEKGDAFEFKPSVPCDAAINWWTSFGYAQNDERNLTMLRRAYEAVRPGGYFALDYPNLSYVFRATKPSEVKRFAGEEGEIILIRESELDLINGLRKQLWTFIMPDGSKLVHDTALRLYAPHSIVQMLSACGFESTDVFGDIKGNPLHLDSDRCIFITRRPL